MKTLGKYWKSILAALLLLLAVGIYMGKYRPMKQNYGQQKMMLEQQCTALQTSITENLRYAKVKELLPAEQEKLEASRLALYEKFPRALKEEDQLLYLMDLEKEWPKLHSAAMGFSYDLFNHFNQKLGTTVHFQFGKPMTIYQMTDGAQMVGIPITIYFNGTYSGMKKMAEYLAQDPRLTSVLTADMDWLKDPKGDGLTGTFTVLCYTIDTDKLEYEEPEITEAPTGKTDIFK